MNEKLIRSHIKASLVEDIGSGDHSSLSCIPKEALGKAYLVTKEAGIIAGLEVAKMVFNEVESTIQFTALKKDGDKIEIGDEIFEVEGPSASILTAERLALNYLQRMSGIATRTSQYCNLINHTNTRVLDTRKTTPGMRYFEKWAVSIGGGFNHRFGLFDMIMLKDNHIDFAGGINAALNKTHQYLKDNKLDLPIEVETRNLTEVKEVLEHGGADRIMLDNFSTELTKEAVSIIKGRIEIESSGGINLETVTGYANCGVDFISVGDLTHHIHSLDLSLKAR